MLQSHQQSWSIFESKDFGKFAIEYAAGKDIILDKNLIIYEIKVDKAHTVMLLKQGIISKKVAQDILKALVKLEKLHQEGKWEMKKELEDVHSNVENFLEQETGVEVSGYLRLGIARNDQIYTDTRMYMKDKILGIAFGLLEIIKIFANEAKKHTKTIMPGYTHLRLSQPITYGFWLLGKAYHFLDDLNDLLYTFSKIDRSSLGVVQMAGTHLPIDRKFTSELLGFSSIAVHAQYIAQQRGELETNVLANFSTIGMHIRRIMNEYIIFSGYEFGMMEIDDLYATGGTGQPNLKNPDTLEIVRANCPTFYSKLMQLFMIMDMLPSGNNRDAQQTKPILFDSVTELEAMLPIFAGIIESTQIYEKRMKELAELNYGIAPDFCMELAVKGKVSFREIYKVVKYLIKVQQIPLDKLTSKNILETSQELLKKEIHIDQKDIDTFSNVEHVVLNRNSLGGTSDTQCEQMLDDVSAQAQSLQKILSQKQTFQTEADKKLESEIQKII